jgi:hypothetical protein
MVTASMRQFNGYIRFQRVRKIWADTHDKNIKIFEQMELNNVWNKNRNKAAK